jgi:hypothetical protein
MTCRAVAVPLKRLLKLIAANLNIGNLPNSSNFSQLSILSISKPLLHFQ